MTLIYAPAALNDLDSIEEYIGESSPENAIRIGDSLRECCESLARTPGQGPPRDDLEPGLQYFPHTKSQYLIFYRVRGNHVEIARVLHGALDYKTRF